MKRVVTTWTCEQCKKTRTVSDPPDSGTALTYDEKTKALVTSQIEEILWRTVSNGAGDWEAHYCSEKCLRDRLNTPAESPG